MPRSAGAQRLPRPGCLRSLQSEGTGSIVSHRLSEYTGFDAVMAPGGT